MKLVCRGMSVLSESEKDQIWQAALRVFRKVPLRVQGTDEFYQYLRDFGCQIDGELVRFPEPVVEKLLDRISQAKASTSPRPPETFPDTITYGASGQALWMCEVGTNHLRPATERDLADWSRLCDAFPKLQRYHPTFIPQDVPTATCDVHAFATIMLNASRPWRVSVYSADNLPYFIELQKVWSGSLDEVKKAPIFAAKVWYNSPFMITRENIEIGMRARELLGRPLELFTMPVAGIATPVTLAGCLAHITAEVLGCNVISLAVDNRLIGYCAGPLVFDMRTGIHTQTGPDTCLLYLAASEMASHIFGGTVTSGSGPTTAAKVPGAQSMEEKSMHTMWAILGGVRDFGSLGILAFADIGSPVQLVLDVEMMTFFERLLRGIAVDEERIAEEVIETVAPTGARFIDTDHTAGFFRDELWLPELLDRRVPMAWAEDPRTMLENATTKATQLLQTAPNKCPLTDAQKKQVREIVAEADAKTKALKRI